LKKTVISLSLQGAMLLVGVCMLARREAAGERPGVVVCATTVCRCGAISPTTRR
jgi:hypothetical protein